jgi:hypothetical protein
MSYRTEQIGSGNLYRIVREEDGKVQELCMRRDDDRPAWAENVNRSLDYIQFALLKGQADAVVWALNNP